MGFLMKRIASAERLLWSSCRNPGAPDVTLMVLAASYFAV
jgi:hypothetical protein